MVTIPINDDETRDDHISTSGQTTFPYTFWIKDQEDLDVYVNGTLKTITTDYTVSAVQQTSGANVVFLSGLNDNDKVAIVYSPDVERLTEFQSSGDPKIQALNLELSYMISLMQYLKTEVNRTFKLSPTVNATNLNISDPTSNAGKLIRVDSVGTGLEYATIAADSTVIGGYEVERFNGDNSTTDFSLSYTPAAQNGLLVHVGGTFQVPGVDFTLSGDTVSFTSAPASGTNNIVVVNLANNLSASSVTDGGITTAKLADGAVTEDKLATGDTVTKDKIDDDLISTYTSVTPTLLDSIWIADESDGNNMKKSTLNQVNTLLPYKELERVTLASNGPNIDIASSIDSTYRSYMFDLDIGLLSIEDFFIRLSDDGGATYESGASDYRLCLHRYATTGATYVGTAASDRMQIAPSATAQGRIQGWVHMSMPQNGVSGTQIRFHLTDNLSAYIGWGGIIASDTIEGIRFATTNSINLTSGSSVVMYGLL